MRHPWRLIFIALLFPSLLALTVIFGATNTQSNKAAIPAAIVNEDEIATLPTGQKLPGGRQIIAALTSDTQDVKGWDWSVVTAATAASGLEDGTYAVVVTIPSDFSRTLADLAQGKTSTRPALTIHTSHATNEATGRIATAITRAGATRFGQTLTLSFIDQSLQGLGTLSQGLNQSASGAQKITDAQIRAAHGATQLSEGLTQAQKGGHTLADGASELSSGIRALHSGIVEAQPGQALSLVQGAEALAQGIEQYTKGVERVHSALTEPQPGHSVSLQEGAHQIAAGSSELKALIDSLNIAQLRSTVEKIKNQRSEFEALIAPIRTDLTSAYQACQQGNIDSCAHVQELITTIGDDVSHRIGIFSEDIDHIIRISKVLPSLVDNIGKVDQLASATVQLSEGIDTLSENIHAHLLGDNADRLSAGARQLSEGIHALSNGSDQLVHGGSALASGALKLADGLDRLNDGGHDLSVGLHDLASGTQTLTDGLQSAAERIPHYTDAQAHDLASALAAPINIGADTHQENPHERAYWSATAIAVALWLSAAVWIMVFGAATTRRIHQARTPFQLVWRTALPPIAIALTGTAILMGSITLAGVSITHPATLFILVTVVTLACLAFHYASICALGVRRALGLSVFFTVMHIVLLGGALPSHAHTGFFGAIRSFLLLPEASDVFRRLILGSGSGSMQSVLFIAVIWICGSSFVVIRAIGRRRQRSVRQILRDVKERKTRVRQNFRRARSARRNTQ
ncbi:YhgE/Pip domain-containing protein [Schaalia sp. lx-100]|uniref:YhgE/Pip domain-containing protein n=1 Tax=Schaalia sp. lx-100 TaxID=2899081 RepID=UPI001E490D6D|nr:YhgE/Pip domain-containing protein [Schaalia sp. lx-100]MCD4557480.1 YhgE/Pip domain-containing protein [Schaalia sp. lx-100]